ncbi:MAG: hypothetical protein BZ138_05780 [Methanosphaera sp. rholeuAM270]|nr:MAG: hypothetical protein BZ138_05780 [Methanosphaera sp. rholeuAM270]
MTTYHVEMLHGEGVTFRATIDYKNTTISQGKVYFEIDGNPLVDEKGFILYAPVEDNWAFLPYKMPSNISVGNHTLTAVYTYDNRILATDNKTLTLIESIPGGAGEKEEIPSEDIKQETYTKDTTHQKSSAKHAKIINSAIATSHKVITDNNEITLGNTITLDILNELFGQTFTNGHLLLYIDGKLVFNRTVGDDLSTVILEIMEKYLGEHEMKVEFTDSGNESKIYTKNVTIN